MVSRYVALVNKDREDDYLQEVAKSWYSIKLANFQRR